MPRLNAKGKKEGGRTPSDNLAPPIRSKSQRKGGRGEGEAWFPMNVRPKSVSTTFFFLACLSSPSSSLTTCTHWILIIWSINSSSWPWLLPYSSCACIAAVAARRCWAMTKIYFFFLIPPFTFCI